MEQAVVLGASGGLGKAVVDQLVRRNIPTRILVRNIEAFKAMYPSGEPPGRVSAIQGDLDSNQALANAMEQADTVFPCFNTKYHRWKTDMVRWIRRVGDLSAALQAKIIFPGTILNFGAQNKPIDEESKQSAPIDLGQLRIAFEQRFARSALEGATLTIVRFPTLFGPAIQNSLIADLFTNALRNKISLWFGNPHAQHDFVSTNDAAMAMVMAALEPKANDAVFHISSGNPISSHDFINKIYQNAGSQMEKSYALNPVWKNKLRALFSKEQGELEKLHYLFESDFMLDDSKFNQVIGKPPHSDIDEAIKETLAWYKFYYEIN